MTAATATLEVFAPPRAPYLRLVRASGAYDLIVTVGFATPWTFALVHAALNSLSDAFGTSGFPEPDLMQVLYANLMGSVVVIWSLLRVVRPLRLHGLFDGFARILFSIWMAYALALGAPNLLWLFLAAEISWGVVQLAPWFDPRFRGAPDRPVRRGARVSF